MTVAKIATKILGEMEPQAIVPKPLRDAFVGLCLAFGSCPLGGSAWDREVRFITMLSMLWAH